MEYLLIIILQFLGIGFHVMQKINELDKKHPEFSIKQVFEAFFSEDWNTLIVSGLIVILNLVIHYIVETYAPDFTEVKHYKLWSFAVAFVMGYAGQRLVYRYLGSAEKLLDKQADKIEQR